MSWPAAVGVVVVAGAGAVVVAAAAAGDDRVGSKAAGTFDENSVRSSCC